MKICNNKELERAINLSEDFFLVADLRDRHHGDLVLSVTYHAELPDPLYFVAILGKDTETGEVFNDFAIVMEGEDKAIKLAKEAALAYKKATAAS